MTSAACGVVDPAAEAKDAETLSGHTNGKQTHPVQMKMNSTPQSGRIGAKGI